MKNRKLTIITVYGYSKLKEYAPIVRLYSAGVQVDVPGRSVIVPKGFLFPKVFIPKGHYSEIFISKRLYSEDLYP